MHNNYHFFKHLVRELAPQLKGLKLMECFSQDRDEMVLGFAAARGLKSNYKQYFIRCSVLPSFPCFYLTKDYKRARKNSVNLWEQFYDLEVLETFVYENERAIGIKLENNITICLKMFGNRSNILIFENGLVRFIFNQTLKGDRAIEESKLNRKIPNALAEFDGSLNESFPTFGKIPKLHLKKLGFDNLTLTEQKSILAELLSVLENPPFYLTKINGISHLSLIELGEVFGTYHSAIEALNSYFIYGQKNLSIEKERQEVLKILNKEIKSINSYLQKSENRLNELADTTKNQDIGHILMANLHAIPPRIKEIELFDFINEKPISIKLKEDLSAQKNAENYYRKAKNEQLEVKNIQNNIEARTEKLLELEDLKSEIEESDHIKELRKIASQLQTKKVTEHADLFKRFECEGFTILVGKSAKNNDELTLKYAKKNDLWLHARDVSGSHVVIKDRPGRKISEHVLEYAAGIALHFSKRKNESLAPVIYCEKKFVRKIKGSPDGQVIVSKESVIMVPPLNPNS